MGDHPAAGLHSGPMPAEERRSPFSSLAALLLFATIAIGTSSILSLMMSLGRAVEASLAVPEAALPLASRWALLLARLLDLNYWPCLLVVALCHLGLLAFDLWAGRTPARLLWATVLTCFLVSTQLLLLLWLAVAYVSPLLR